MSEPAVVDTPAGGNTSTAAPSAPVGSAAPAAGTPPSTAPAGAGTSAAETKYSYKEDRSTWVPSHVVRERTERAERLERELFYERQRVAALSGVKPPTPPEDPESAAIKSQFFKLFPWAEKLNGLSAEQIERLAALDPDALQQTAMQPWVAHGTTVLNTLNTKLRDAYGGADLSPKVLQRVQRMFVSEITDDPQLRARYERGDLSVIDEFVQDYTAGMLDPYRRTTTAAAAPRQIEARRLPRGGAGSAIAGGAPPTVTPSDGDAFHKASWAKFTANR